LADHLYARPPYTLQVGMVDGHPGRRYAEPEAADIQLAADVGEPLGASSEGRRDVVARLPLVVERHAVSGVQGAPHHGAAAAAQAVDQQGLGDAFAHHGALPLKANAAATASAVTIQNRAVTFTSLMPASSKW